MNVGCVKEIKSNEFRVGLTPDNVAAYTAQGHKVAIEAGAGIGSGYSDQEYEAAGAKILSSAKEVWDFSEMMVKVKEPLEEEYAFFRKDLILYTYLHLAADRPQTDALLQSGVKAVAYETLTEKDHSLPLLAPMSQIAGRLSIQEGAKCLEKPFGGSGILLSGVPGTEKAKVLILGAGTVGANACKVAVGMGADVTITDINLARLAYLDDIFGSRIQTLYSTDAQIRRQMAQADLVIGSVLIPGKAAPKLIKKAYLSEMKPGSVIVDVAVDQGGCCETTKVTYHDNPTFVVDGVVHYCVGNMPGAVPRTATAALTNATLRYGLAIAGSGLEEACRKNPVIYSGINTYQGKLTCKNVADSFGLEYTDITSLIH
ncbi:alanine dehydrogenase [Hominifimenecus sp. rT4P-3]|uniref:alanine dehydrogenase n=1 Tax=Hominifimenecus sp. rT4P-3 TaxID=3242979 RepID=UPI003DA4FC7B